LKNNCVHIIGAGLAGSEAAWQAATRGQAVILYDMKGCRLSPAHRSLDFAELVCSNSLRSDDPASAIGLLHHELRALGSLIMAAADRTKVPAGGALAVDRQLFSRYITDALTQHPLIDIRRAEVTELPPDAEVIVATGPLTDGGLARHISSLTGQDYLHFFDALAPIIEADSINRAIVWEQSRYDKGTGSDYLNCPLDRDQYYAFVDALLNGRTVPFKPWEIQDLQQVKYFEGCLPIEVMAARGKDTLAYGPMKPRGLTDPATGRRPFAVVQLRKENAAGTLFNIVGFQTKLTHPEQQRIFRTIPGLEHASFARLGGLHRNSFINSPRLLDRQLRLKTHPHIRFAGQITGCEGYVESAAIGLLAGLNCPRNPPPTTAIGALLAHIVANANPETFAPMNINFGLFPSVPATISKKNRKDYILATAHKDFTHWQANQSTSSEPA
jgi:methylenetetrahydrofolate--tRNA-(uracil-5-)-methyltransferase